MLLALRAVFFSAYWIPAFVGMTALRGKFLINAGGFVLRIIK
jgi:hypothetical protein